jgi:hypothetical protein
MYTRSAVLAPPTYVGLGRFQHGPETMFQMGVTQIWYLVSVTPIYEILSKSAKK